MTLYPGVDASHIPGTPLPAGTRIIAGYIGAKDLAGQPDTPHIWTAAEWNIYLDPGSPVYGGPELRCLPIYTRDYQGNPDEDANNAADAATDLGWSHDGSRVIAWDSEFLADDWYASNLRAGLHKRGFKLMTYEQTPAQDPSADFRWIFRILPRGSAQPTELPAGEDGWQWSFGNDWDHDVFSERVYHYCGQGLRKVNP